MPSPLFKKIDINFVVKRAIDFYKMSSLNEILFHSTKEKLIIKGDEEQLYRVLINLIKNSEESISEKREKNIDFKGKISVEINDNIDYITIKLIDNGTGIENPAKIMTPYFTTKKDGTGLGLPIVSKIINEHNGEISITNHKDGVKIAITLPQLK
jgi:two-component system nitrogen regulation sensor histidine kinase NtrY